MQNASSYMVPKLVLANVLAVIMMLFEQHAPADMPQKPQNTSQSSVEGNAGNQAGVAVAGVTQPEAVKAATPKKRSYKVHHTKSSPLQLTNARTPGPVECCFRGYKS